MVLASTFNLFLAKQKQTTTHNNVTISHVTRPFYSCKMAVYCVVVAEIAETCVTDHWLLISRAINKFLENHSMPLSNCSLIVFNELWFSLQTQVLIVAMQETVYINIIVRKQGPCGIYFV